MSSITYIHLPTDDISDYILKECAVLFSNNYGVWSASGPFPGQRVKISSQRLRRDYLFNGRCGLVIATSYGRVIGHSFFTSFQTQGGEVRWITQLVVDPLVRHRKIAQNLILSSIQTDWSICGLVTSHPYAVRALEKATGLICVPRPDLSYFTRLSEIPYIHPDVVVDEGRIIDTEFYVDHTEILGILSHSPGWKLGDLPEGHEFFAFVSR